MNIEDLKGLMDSFEPASLLPELDTLLGKVELVMRIAVLVGPIVLLALGLIYLFVSPKEANYYLGYRCFFGMGSVSAWRFSQRLAGIVWTLLGLVLTVVMVLISGTFRGMDAMDMVWKAVRCGIWQAVLTALSCLAINGLVAANYNSRGELRRKRK